MSTQIENGSRAKYNALYDYADGFNKDPKSAYVRDITQADLDEQDRKVEAVKKDAIRKVGGYE